MASLALSVLIFVLFVCVYAVPAIIHADHHSEDVLKTDPDGTIAFNDNYDENNVNDVNNKHNDLNNKHELNNNITNKENYNQDHKHNVIDHEEKVYDHKTSTLNVLNGSRGFNDNNFDTIDMSSKNFNEHWENKEEDNMKKDEDYDGNDIYRLIRRIYKIIKLNNEDVRGAAKFDGRGIIMADIKHIEYDSNSHDDKNIYKIYRINNENNHHEDKGNENVDKTHIMYNKKSKNYHNQYYKDTVSEQRGDIVNKLSKNNDIPIVLGPQNVKINSQKDSVDANNDSGNIRDDNKTRGYENKVSDQGYTKPNRIDKISERTPNYDHSNNSGETEKIEKNRDGENKDNREYENESDERDNKGVDSSHDRIEINNDQRPYWKIISDGDSRYNEDDNKDDDRVVNNSVKANTVRQYWLYRDNKGADSSDDKINNNYYNQRPYWEIARDSRHNNDDKKGDAKEVTNNGKNNTTSHTINDHHWSNTKFSETVGKKYDYHYIQKWNNNRRIYSRHYRHRDTIRRYNKKRGNQYRKRNRYHRHHYTDCKGYHHRHYHSNSYKLSHFNSNDYRDSGHGSYNKRTHHRTIRDDSEHRNGNGQRHSGKENCYKGHNHRKIGVIIDETLCKARNLLNKIYESIKHH